MTRSSFSTFRFIVFFLCLSGVVFHATPSDARSFWDVLFGPKEEETQGPPPEQTLQAPFIDPNASKAAQKATSPQMMDIYNKGEKMVGSNTLSLDQPHRSPEIIATWAAGVVAQALSFSPATFNDLEKKINPDFSTYGMQEYKTYLNKMGLMRTLTTNHLKVMTISEGKAQVIRDGVVDGTYHWLVQVPVMTSFYDQSLNVITDKRAKIAQNQKLLFQVQIGRSAQATNDLGIKIERWVAVSQ